MKKKWMCKILRYMRNLFLLLLISASSIWARDGYSQKSQEIFSVKSGTIESIFRQIKKQSGYEFFYNTAVLDVKENVSLATPNGTLEDILSQVLGNKYSYSIRDNYILISGKKHVLPDEVKKIVIKGLVKDRKGESLPGVSVLLKGTTVGVATDVKGEFMLTIPGAGHDRVTIHVYRDEDERRCLPGAGETDCCRAGRERYGSRGSDRDRVPGD